VRDCYVTPSEQLAAGRWFSQDGLARNRENVSDISDICVFVDSCFSYAVIAFELSVFVSVLLVEETGVP
jgi:hypothetical protein